MKKVQWGLVGLGQIAEGRLLPAINESENSQLIALCSRSESKAKAWASRFGAKKAYCRYSKMIRDPGIDVIAMATPNFLHHKQTIQAAQSGKHVFCEKPMAMTVEECEEMIEACSKNGVKLMIGYMLRFKSHHIKLKRMIEANKFGTLVFGRAQFHFWLPDGPKHWLQDPEISGGGALMDVGVHCIDTLRFLMGEVTEVSAYADTIVHGYSTDSIALLLLRFKSSAYACVDSSFCTNFTSSPQKLEIYGTEGSGFATTIGSQYGGELETLTSDGLATHKIDEANPYLEEITHFSGCILHDKQPVVSGEEGLKTQKVVAAAYESHKTGQKCRL